MSAWVESDLVTETTQNEPQTTGRSLRTTSRAPEVKGRWLSEAGVASSGHLNAEGAGFAILALPQARQTQRRLIVLSTSSGNALKVKRFSRMPGGFAWAGGIPPQAVNIRDYLRPPLQEASVDPEHSVNPLLVDTSPPLPDEVFRLSQPRAGAYIYVLGEDVSEYAVHVEGETNT